MSIISENNDDNSDSHFEEKVKDHGIDGQEKNEVQNPLSSTFEIDQYTSEVEPADVGSAPPIDHSLRAKMWTKEYVGLYSQYAAVGLMNGSLGMTQSLCVYYYKGATNMCANANNIIQLAWNFKIFYAVLTDSYRPFGMRRKPYMLAGWGLVLVMLFVLALVADKLSGSEWISVLMVCHCFLMVSDVPADGYSVELGQMEPPEERGC